MPMEVNFMIGGEAGQGVQTVGYIISKTFCRGGFFVFADQDYESRIRGGHNFFRVRVNENKVEAIREGVDILIAMNKETIDLHRKEVDKKGVIIYDSVRLTDVAANGNTFGMPLEQMATDLAGDKRAANIVAVGAAMALLKYDLQVLDRVLTDYFGVEGTAGANIKAAQAGYDYTNQNYKGSFDGKIIPHTRPVKRMLINGNEAVALGAIAAGCKFMSGYPMTPTTPILEYMVAKAADFGIAVVQPEDEIAAMNMAVGANYAGVRAMTATSGSGFCLMTEGLGLAGITETPMVVIEGQRPGPAVGMPTRTEQGDLEFVIHAHQGDFPRAVLAPSDAESAFWLTIKAFNLAEKYQIPVIVLTDHYLATSYFTVDRFDLSQVVIDRGQLYTEDGKPEAYKRHQDTLSGISPRAFPGLGKTLVVTDADEHDENGHLNETAATRNQQMGKRGRKLFELKHRDIAPPELFGPKRAEITLIGWGSTYGPIREAVEMMHKDGQKVNFLPLTELWPFPAEAVADMIRRNHPVYVIENNYSGQLSHLIQAETGKKVENRILKFDGRPFTPEYIVEQVKKGQGE